MQIISSFGVNICYCATTIRFDSVLTAFIALFLTNITGTGNVFGNTGNDFWLYIMIYTLWNAAMCFRQSKTQRR